MNRIEAEIIVLTHLKSVAEMYTESMESCNSDISIGRYLEFEAPVVQKLFDKYIKEMSDRLRSLDPYLSIRERMYDKSKKRYSRIQKSIAKKYH